MGELRVIKVDRYRVNEVLTQLASELGVRVSDEMLNALTHSVAEAFEEDDASHD